MGCTIKSAINNSWLEQKTYEIEVTELIELKEKQFPVRFGFMSPVREGVEDGIWWYYGNCVMTNYNRETCSVSEASGWYEYNTGDNNLVIYKCVTCGVILFQAQVKPANNGVLFVFADGKNLFYKEK